MKRSRKQKPKPHETLDGLKAIVEHSQISWGHNLEWREEKSNEAIAVCTLCNAVAVIVLRPAGIENVITGEAINKSCLQQHEKK